MKLSFALVCVILSVCLIMKTEAFTVREPPKIIVTGGLYYEQCPNNSQEYDTCNSYADLKSKSMQSCHNYVIVKSRIAWEICGDIECDTRLIKPLDNPFECNGINSTNLRDLVDLNLITIQENLQRDYPYCCKHCEIYCSDGRIVRGDMLPDY